MLAPNKNSVTLTNKITELAVRLNVSEEQVRFLREENQRLQKVEHDLQQVKAELEKAIELGGQEPEISFELSKVLRALCETEAAKEQLKLYQQGLKAKSDRTLSALKSTQAEEAIAAGDKQKAAALYREACAALPSDASLSYRLALVLQDLNDVAGERTALDQAVKANPKYAPAEYQLGYLASRDGDTAAAEKLFRSVGRGFIPGIKPIKSTWASAPEVCFSSYSPETWPFSVACLAPADSSLNLNAKSAISAASLARGMHQ